jgi:hypothetical protein
MSGFPGAEHGGYANGSVNDTAYSSGPDKGDDDLLITNLGYFERLTLRDGSLAR